MNPASTLRLILASESPRRAQLLSDNGYRFEVVRPPLDEPEEDGPHVPPAQHAAALSYYKARSVASRPEYADAVILAADTVVALGDRIFGKPVDAEDARFILANLAGTRHQVITGVTVLRPSAEQRLIEHDLTHVTMRPMSADVLDAYIASEAWRGKAGAYGVQDHGDAYVERLEGSYTNVVGLPMSLVARMLGRVGYVVAPADRPA